MFWEYNGEQNFPQNPTFEWLTQEVAEDAWDETIMPINTFQESLVRAP